MRDSNEGNGDECGRQTTATRATATVTGNDVGDSNGNKAGG